MSFGGSGRRRAVDRGPGRSIHRDERAASRLGQGRASEPVFDSETALGRYLEHVVSRNRYLQLQGIRSGGKLVHIELDRIYVRLRATQQRGDGGSDDWLAEAEELAPGEVRCGSKSGAPARRDGERGGGAVQPQATGGAGRSGQRQDDADALSGAALCA